MSWIRKIGFRVDASSDLGLGHLMRCSALAKMLGGWEHPFWMKDIPAARGLLIGGPVHYISPDLDLDRELNFLNREMRAAGIDTIVVDFLRYPDGYIEKLKAMGFFLVTFHEYERECPFSDIVINYNSFRGFDTINAGEGNCLGPSYVILREGIRMSERRNPAIAVTNILVSMGGSDPKGIVFKAAAALARLQGSFHIIVHIGPAFKHREMLSELSSLPNVAIEDHVEELAALMAKADLAISAGGNTMYELCYLGVPAIIISQNEHQQEFAEGIAASGAVISLGLHSDVTEQEVAHAAGMMIGDYRLRRALSERGREVIDGRGCERLVKKIVSRLETVRHE